MPNAYLVAPRLDALPRRLDELPDDLQRLVRKHTAASFVVEHREPEELIGLSDNTQFSLVPVILRYEFKLQRRLASGPQMQARITRRLDPVHRQSDKYTHAPKYFQDALEDACKCEQVFAPFSALQVRMHKPFSGLLCFVRGLDGPYFPLETHELADEWTECPRTVVAELREKLRTVFGVELRVIEDLEHAA
jgi:hypothetical protein